MRALPRGDLVPDRYAHGDHIKCGACRTKHKVVRGDRLRLVLADVGPLRDALGQNQQLVERLEAELAHARPASASASTASASASSSCCTRWASRAHPSRESPVDAVGIAIVTGLALEAANWSFLAKRSAITRIASELDEARAEGRCCGSRSARRARSEPARYSIWPPSRSITTVL